MNSNALVWYGSGYHHHNRRHTWKGTKAMTMRRITKVDDLIGAVERVADALENIRDLFYQYIREETGETEDEEEKEDWQS
jgi:hypothetical protein